MIQRGILLCDWDSNRRRLAARTPAALDSLTTYIAVQERGFVFYIALRMKPERRNSRLGPGDDGQQEFEACLKNVVGKDCTVSFSCSLVAQWASYSPIEFLYGVDPGCSRL